MSATATVTTSEAMLLLSDGIAVNTEGLKPSKDMVISEDRITSRNYRKAWKLSENIGVLWTGNLHGFMDKFSDRISTASPKAAGQSLTEGIRKCIDQSGFQKWMPEAWFNVNVHVLGYNGKLEYWHIVKKNGRIVLEEAPAPPPGEASCKSPHGNLSSQFKTYLDPSDPISTGKEAFIATLEAQPDNMPLGGEIFSEVITNPKK